MNIRPLGDRILVEPSSEEGVTHGGILLPDTADKDKKAEGIVMAIGDGEKVKALRIKKGDMVMFGKYSGEDVEVKNAKGKKVDYKFLKHDEVLAVLS